MGGALGQPLLSQSINPKDYQALLAALRDHLGGPAPDPTAITITPEQTLAVAEFWDLADGHRWAEYNRKFNALLKGE